MTSYATAVGTRLRIAREALGMSHTAVAVTARPYGFRWPAERVAAWERGEGNLGMDTLRNLAGFYGVPVAELLPARAGH